MPSKRSTDQAILWLKCKMAEGDTLDAINAELCYNVIMDIQKKRKVIGALYHQTYEKTKRKKYAGWTEEKMDKTINDYQEGRYDYGSDVNDIRQTAE